MKPQRILSRIAVFFMMAAVISPCLLPDALAFREERRGYYGGVEREDEFAVGPRGGAAAVGPHGGAVAVGPYGGVAVRGPQGNVLVGRAVGDRVVILPDSATAVAVGDQMYYVDASGVYYLPCTDDATVFCVVPAPQ